MSIRLNGEQGRVEADVIGRQLQLWEWQRQQQPLELTSTLSNRLCEVKLALHPKANAVCSSNSNFIQFYGA